MCAAAYKPGWDGSDECWGTGTTTYNAGTLATASPGCIIDPTGTTGFAVCDVANGWHAPMSPIDNTWDGKCIPACYMAGQDDDGAGGSTMSVSIDWC